MSELAHPLVPASMQGSAGPRSTLWRLAGLVGAWWLHLAGAFVSGFIARLSQVVLLVLGVLLIERLAAGAATEELYPLAIGMVVAAAFRAGGTWVEMWLVHVVAYGMLSRLRRTAYAALEPRAPAYTSTRRSGDLVSMIMGDIETIELFFAHTIVPIILATLVPLVLLIWMATMSPWLAITLIPFLVVAVVLPMVSGERRERTGQMLRQRHALVNSHFVDSIQGMREVLGFGRGQARANEIGDISEEFAFGMQVPNRRVVAGLTAASDPLMILAAIAVLVVAGALLSAGAISPQEVPLAVIASIGAFIPVLELSSVRFSLNEVIASGRRYLDVLDMPIPVAERTRQPVGHLPPSISFENVYFAYDPSGTPVLMGLSFDVEAGETVALVGVSGAGKSTCVSLLLRFWDPTSGTIKLGGVDLRDFPLDDLRQRVAVVQQDNYLFNVSIRDNIRLARTDASDVDVEEAAQRANLHDFITTLDQGYDTVIGERGVKLSGGQRQRVALARAFLKDAPVLILDEATSNLDTENEVLIRQSVSRLMKGRTTVVIAHRLSSIASANRVIMIEHGRVVASGHHSDLVRDEGRYAQLVAAQRR